MVLLQLAEVESQMIRSVIRETSSQAGPRVFCPLLIIIIDVVCATWAVQISLANLLLKKAFYSSRFLLTQNHVKQLPWLRPQSKWHDHLQKTPLLQLKLPNAPSQELLSKVP